LREDRLGRGDFARLIAAQVVAPRLDDGFVLAVTGAWGGGKTSTLRFIESELGDEVLVVRFNPWLFGAGDDLIRRFLAEMGNQLPAEKRFRPLRRRLDNYVEVLTPLRGLAGVAAKVLEKVLGRSAEQDRDAVADALRQLDRRVLVVLDDLDRLAPGEVADVVRLVKLVGDFPNTTYLMAYDRQQVESALAKAHGGSGRDYLDKIVQASYPLPHIETGVLGRLLAEALESRLPATMRSGNRELDDRWPAILTSVITPLLRTVRDVRRVANVAPTTAGLTGDDVALEDVLALECVRVLLPDVYDDLAPSARALTRQRQVEVFRSHLPDDKDQIDRLIEAGGANAEVARALIRQLFPAAERHLNNTEYGPEFAREWRKERRVATYAGLLTYLTKALGEHAVRAAKVRSVLDSLGDVAQFEDEVASIPIDQLPDLLARLTDYLDAVPAEPRITANAVANLLNLIPTLPEERRSFFDVDAEFLVAPLAGGLLERLALDARDGVAELVFDRVTSIYGQFRLVQWFGDHGEPQEGRQEPLLSADMTKQLRGRVRARLLNAEPGVLRGERHFARLIGVLLRDGGEEGERRLNELIQNDDFMLRLLVAFASRNIDEDDEGRVLAERGITLDWDALVQRVGEASLTARVRELGSAFEGQELSADERTVLDLARRHAGE
jgi:hypothetical protein